MNKSAHIFKELAALLPTLQERYKEKDVFFIALRLDNRATAKVEVFLEELMPSLFSIIDTNNDGVRLGNRHKIWQQDEYKSCTLLSIFICDSSSQTVYDSRYYEQTPQKYNLKRDKDIRVLQFQHLDEDERGQVVDMITAQIAELQDDVENGVVPEDKGPASNWGEMPWDFQK